MFKKIVFLSSLINLSYLSLLCTDHADPVDESRIICQTFGYQGMHELIIYAAPHLDFYASLHAQSRPEKAVDGYVDKYTYSVSYNGNKVSFGQAQIYRFLKGGHENAGFVKFKKQHLKLDHDIIKALITKYKPIVKKPKV